MASFAGTNVVRFPAPAGPPASEPARDDDGDWLLLERIGRGDEPAFEVFYKRYRHYLERFVYQVTRRPDLVDDVISEVMLAVWQQAARPNAWHWRRPGCWASRISSHCRRCANSASPRAAQRSSKRSTETKATSSV